MRTIVYEKFGSPEVLKIKETVKPEVTDDSMLIRVRATSVTKYDCWQRKATGPTGFGWIIRLTLGPLKPKKTVLGTELAGEVEAVGRDVTGFKAGDSVIGYMAMGMGAYAEYVCLPEKAEVVRKPQKASFEEAGSMMQGALTALYFLKKGHVEKGRKILIYGASGGVGIPAVQLAKHLGAEVTGVCSGSKSELVKSLGAEKTIDYKTEDFSKTGETYDVILDTTGKCPVLKCGKLLKKGGWYLSTTFGIPQFFRMSWFKQRTGTNLYVGALDPKADDMEYLCKLVESGDLKILVDKTFPAEQAAAAHAYVESGQKAGNVVLTF